MRHSPRLPLLVAALAVAIAGVAAIGAVVPGGPADFFLAYKTKKPRGAPRFTVVPALRLADRFEDRRFDAVAVGDLLVPAAVDGMPIADDVIHLQAYALKPSKVCTDDRTPCASAATCTPGARCKRPAVVKRPGQTLVDAFGTRVVDLAKPDRLLVPSTKSLAAVPAPPDPQSHGVDHYKCYKAKVARGTAGLPKGTRVTIADQLTTPAKRFGLKALTHVCTPVGVDGAAIRTPTGHLVCFKAKRARGEPKHAKRLGVGVANELGALRRDTVSETALCVPAAPPVAVPTPTSTAAASVTPTATPTAVGGLTPTPSPTPTGGLPPDPAGVAPTVVPGVGTTVFASTAFLYTGPNAVQSGVAPGTIELERAAVIRGKVFAHVGAPLASVTVAVLGHPELGETRTRADGAYDLAVNGGGPLTLSYEMTGLLPAQRQIEVPWQDWVVAPDVMLVPLDDAVTTIMMEDDEAQVARGTPMSDADGTRQATLLFPPGTTAEMVMPGGDAHPMASLAVRATEYTVGPDGPMAMPAALPPTSGYTYAVELSADEAIAAGATRVTFDQPLPFYVENFLGFPTGTWVPSGFYDQERGRWEASDSGRVIEILGVTGGLADVDVDGNGLAEEAAGYAEAGIGDGERAQLATLYAPGQTLWRIPIAHFTPWDFNFPYGPPPDSDPPCPTCGPTPPDKKPPKDPCENEGSIIECQGQTLGETIDLVGVPFDLHYRSDRVPGRRASADLEIRLTGPTVPPPLQGVRLEITVAGRVFKESFPPQPNLTHVFTWDGKDAYGRPVNGRQRASVRIGYEYVAQYFTTSSEFAESFTRFGSPPISRAVFSSGGGGGGGGAAAVFDIARVQARNTAPPITLFEDYEAVVGGALDPRAQTVGGWTLGVHHLYDVVGRELLLGDGGRRPTDAGDLRIGTLAGLGNLGVSGIPAAQARLGRVDDLEVGPDGSLYLADSTNQVVRRIDRDGIISTVAGSFGFACSAPSLPCGDGGVATQAQLREPQGIAVGPDGTLYIADTNNARIRRVGTDGIITTIAGVGTLDFGFNGDGLPALETTLRAQDVALGPDGSLYFSHVASGRVRRIGPDGIVTTVAGPGASPDCNSNTAPCGDGGYATDAGLFEPGGLAVGSDGSLYIATSQHRVRRVGPDGIIATVAGTGVECAPAGNLCGDGGPATAAQLALPYRLSFGPDGALYIANQQSRVRKVAPDGTITTVAGRGTFAPPAGDGGFATAASIPGALGVAVVPNGSFYVSHSGGFDQTVIRVVQPLLPGIGASEIGIPDEDGGELWVFDPTGRHERTLDPLTGALVREFAYDAANRLLTVTDADGNVTTIERDGAGAPTAIVAPGGQRTTLALDAAGYLASVTNPAGQTVAMTYAGDAGEGLLTTFTGARSQMHQFTYDADGLLVRDQGPDGYDVTLARTALGDGHYQVALTTAEGLTTTYEVEQLPTGAVQRTRTDPGGDQTVALLKTDGTRTITYPDGTVATLVSGPDPRFGVLAPILASLTVTTPGGIAATRTASRTVTLASPTDPLSLMTQTDTIVRNGKTSTRVYDAATRTFTTTTAGGRTVVAALDARGRLVGEEIDPGLGVLPMTYAYDVRGRLQEASHGPQSWTWTYDAKHRRVARTDARGESLAFAFDLADRVSAASLPSDRAYAFTRDASGNPTALAMPSAAAHQLAYTPADLFASYAPPGNAPYVTTYDDDRRLTAITLPSGRTETLAYDAANRLTSLAHPAATVGFTYTAGRRITEITHTPTTGPPQTIAFEYDADLPTRATWTGAASAEFDYVWNADFLLTSVAVASGLDDVTTAYVRDDDGLVTGLGPLTLSRTGPGGAPTAITDGTATWTYAYDALGRIASRALAVGGTERFAVTFTYDSVGRITRKVETIAGAAVTWDYGYDADSQLVEVRRDDDVVETYAYDQNRNRSSRTLGAGAPQSATFDAQDRIIQQGAVAYTTDADGYVVGRGADGFQYAATGELLQASVGGQTVTYAYDGLRRRVARSVGGATTQYLYGNPDEAFQVTHTREAAGTLTTYYYDDGNRLLAFERAGERFYVGVDQLGSPIVVTDDTGALVKVRGYDAYGSLTADSAPAFELAVGFAGGLGDFQTGLVRFGLRDLDPVAGRWMTRDQALYEGGQANLYAYVNNSPVNLVDPSGLFSIEVSAYEGLGAGFKFGIDTKGVSVCGEVGVGFGNAVEVDVLDGTDNTSLGLLADAEVKRGNAKIKAKGEFLVNFGPGKVGDCPPAAELKGELKFCGGPVCGGFEGSTREDLEGRAGLGVNTEGSGDLGSIKNLLKGGVGNGAEAKLAVKACQHASF